MIFIDVENTSSERDLVRVLDELRIEGLGSTAEVTAIGNWRVVGQGLARSLAARGAELVHSAPALRVPDWSDLWIAVQAGIWLGRAHPGDTIEIVSHDRAFDAVGDAAARLGVAFRRITYRTQGAPAEIAAAVPEPSGPSAGRRRGDGRGRRPGRPVVARPPTAVHPATTPSDPVAGRGSAELHTASQDEIHVAIARLTAPDPAAGVNIDRLAGALKASGFQRPPGSPRLVTRLRRIKDVEVLPNGRVLLVGETAKAAYAAHPARVPGPDAVVPAPDVQTNAAEASPEPSQAVSPEFAERKRRSRRRGGRRRRGQSRPAEPAPVVP